MKLKLFEQFVNEGFEAAIMPAEPTDQAVNQNIKPIINKVASEGIKNVTPAMMSSEQFKGNYNASSFGGTFNGVNYVWDCTGVPGIINSQFMVAGDIISETAKNMFAEIQKTPADNNYNPESPSIGFYDGNGVNFVIYTTTDGKVKCLKFL